MSRLEKAFQTDPSTKDANNAQHEARLQRFWIQTCIERHPACNETSNTPFVPRRLIDVRSYSSIRLVDTVDLNAKDIRYVALSYCWGRSMPVGATTTKLTLEAHLKKICLKKLPKTLRDAIKVTRSLSIPFIWIDALCIIQGDKNDWEHDLEAMSKIYSRATVTVADAVSDNCAGGFLLRKPRRRWLTSYPASQGDTPEGEVIQYPKHKFFDSPLFTRGWCLQERELSRRIIYFGKEMVIFECRKSLRRYDIKTANRHFFMPMNLSCTDLYTRPNWQRRFLDISTEQQSVIPRRLGINEKVRDAWWATVAAYTTRELTDPMDKLPAIAGILKVLEERHKTTSSAGLLNAHFGPDLLWERAPLAVEGVAAFGYVAPSWSWASTNFAVIYRYKTLPQWPEFVTLAVNIVPAGTNLKGKLASGVIEAEVSIAVISSLAREDYDESALFRSWRVPNLDAINANSGKRYGVQTGQAVEEQSRGDSAPLLRKYDFPDTDLHFARKFEIWVYWDRQSDLDEDVELFFCPVMRLDGHELAVGLALRHVNRDTYRRVGLATRISSAWSHRFERRKISLI